ncbi:NAD(P)H-hydrate dehydratase [Massilia arenosa]|uniref:Bifunctional NAD(P)H-hydrate repair enzyme n=1 Tax=Zemynaea arenosa TaxID=2561931 RepID=A0A4Y9RRI3_9BURK|nr:NAD(P)H-hydrate dehydratase [Massilia arenosa]TFW11493.1 NAD(P)H-hydrate dehydratase [Massilia arenosa]
MQHPLFSVAQIRGIERTAAAGLEPGILMDRAGRAAADHAADLLGPGTGRAVLVLAGPGNNGGDALEVAAHLAAREQVTVIHLRGDGAQPSFETARAIERAGASSATFTDALPSAEPDLVIDGLFGIGLTRPLEGRGRELVDTINEYGCPVLALDLPSGLDADTGAVVGPDGIAVRASHTITFIGDKPGLHTNEGREYAGQVAVVGLDISQDQFPPATALLSTPDLFAHCLRARGQNANKGTFGNVAIVGGAHGMTGAPMLGARAALFTGAGRVFAAFVDPGPAYDSTQPEVMCRLAGGFDFGTATLVLGPGMGHSPDAVRDLLRAFESASPLVIDADALNLIANSPDLQQRLTQRGNAILTPHPLEAARLLGMTVPIVQADRLAAAHELAARFNAVAVLKGSGTVIAHGDQVAVNSTGNPGLATAGTGDVLAGICGSLLAQGWPLWEAALGGVWLHGAAADRLVRRGIGPIGLTAGELPLAARAVLNELVRRYARRRS